MHNRLEDFSRIIPDNFKWLKPVLGWCSKTVNSIADRVVFDKFDNDNFNINQIFDMNSRDIFSIRQYFQPLSLLVVLHTYQQMRTDILDCRLLTAAMLPELLTRLQIC